MITEDYCSYETAKLLKEKGFNISLLDSKNWVCCMYDENGNIHWGIYDGNWYFRITHQMAMKFLREIYNIVIEITNTRVESLGYNYYIVRIIVKGETKKVLKHYNYYENATEAALKYCLEDLI